MIQMKKVSKAFNGEKVVDNVHFSIEKGSIYGLLGSNGAGKTTILKMLSGIYRQDSGEIWIDGQRVYENNDTKKRLFFIPDTPSFLSQYTLKQMAKFYQLIYPGWNHNRFVELSRIFDIQLNKKLHTFSKGVKRQAAFILAFSSMPDVLILDEPMDGLDPVVRKKVKNLLIHDVAEREMTVLISSHNLREIEDLSDHVGILHNGKILLEKDLDDLKSDVHKVQVAFKESIPHTFFKEVNSIHTEQRGSVILCVVRGKEEQISKTIETYNPILFDLLPLTLEEIFIYEMEDVGYAFTNHLVE
ncbi:ABC transporter ATP-binding protein [Bacillus sp. 03113]|uniref:ABC transporter ATP-binding protein n=1 Tax=Bacillus sp. 03113 TaxID=2578211 RepID=UPI001141113B|nr:ABC transporter ATP-binding protein [Bacillus sp. 03113]